MFERNERDPDFNGSAPTAEPALPQPVTAPNCDAPRSSRWIRSGKVLLAFSRGLFALVALATFVSAIVATAQQPSISKNILGSSAYSIVMNILPILFTFRWFPFHQTGFIAQRLPKIVQYIRRFPGIFLSFIDLGGISIVFSLSAQVHYWGDSQSFRVMSTLSFVSGAGHWTTMCAGWLFSIITILKKCCTRQDERDKKHKKKMEAMYEKARAEIKAKELEKQNEIAMPTSGEKKKMTKKEKLEAMYEKARQEKELAEKMVKEELENEKRDVQRPAAPAATPSVLAPPAANSEVVTPAKEKLNMTKKERLERAYERARIEREQQDSSAGTVAKREDVKGKGKARADDMV